MDELQRQLDELNQLAAQVYDYAENSSMRITRRRLLTLEVLLFVDNNVNAVFRLLTQEPRFLDGAEMILRSTYDLGVSGDWVLRSRNNDRLWRWIRDDRKVLHQQLKGLVDIMVADPRLVNEQYPLEDWQDRLKKIDKELATSSKKAGVTVNEGTVSTFSKAKSFGAKAQRLYHTLFWQFSTKTHASPSGLQDLITLHPLHLKRRGASLPQTDEQHAVMLLKAGLLWYVAFIRQTAKYVGAPQYDEATRLYKAQTSRPRS